MKLDNAKAQMRKGVLELCILASIKDERKYATEIIYHLKNVNLIVVEGTLYPLLARLKSAGLLAYEWEESASGPPRKYYLLTKKGNTSLNELSKSWEELQYSVSHLTKSK
ncbi:MAG: PadR family transcriptional regulator [Flavobacteriaceae bacterium]|jgi:PadR family transcriptional regulator PadR